MSIRLDHVIPFGRSLREYELIFNLTAGDIQRTILDCGGGPSSFNAEVTARGGTVVSFDPLYELSGPQIRQRFFETVDGVIAQVERTPDNWVWSYHRDSADLRRNREAALQIFLADYETGLAVGRYVRASLPTLPFSDSRFDLALCSHLLFLYSDLLDLAFHLAAVKEMLRVSRELRIFPLLTLGCTQSPYVDPLRAELENRGWHVSIEPVAYELQRGGNHMMRILRR
jgi:hypothetical protein